MKKFLFITLVLAYICTFVYTASILDYISGEEPAEAREEDSNKKTCLCTGPSCICCVDFNMSLIDLGGPGCVRLHYLGVEEGVSLNVSYGDSLLSSKTVKAPEPEPTCLNIFSKLAQMCAVFTELKPNDDGLTGCLKLEPMLLSEVQLELPIGCFNMNAEGIKEIEKSKESAAEEVKNTEEAEKVDSTSGESKPSDAGNETAVGETDATALLGDLTAADILEAVSATADQGISMISKWLGIKLNPDAVNASDSTVTAEEEEENKN